MLKLETRKKQNQIYKIGSAIFVAGLMGCDPSGSGVNNKEISDLHQKMVNLEDSMKKLPPEVPANGEEVQELKKQMADLNANTRTKGEGTHAFYGTGQNLFLQQCIRSIDITDAEDPVRRNVVNAMAFINSSKIARATEITQHDFDHVSRITTGAPTGYVFVGTKDSLRETNKSHTFHAFSRLPSWENHETLNYFDFDLINNAISGFGNVNIENLHAPHKKAYDRFLSINDILIAQDADVAIDANKIENYNHEDCESIATYMSNVGSKTNAQNVDYGIFRSRTGLMSDVLSRLNERFEEHMTLELGHGYRDTDSHRAMVLQDELMRRDHKGHIDWSFLDLVYAPHLRYLSAIDSEIGKAKVVAGSDYDNSCEGKHPILCKFVERHLKQEKIQRADKEHRELEAVFLNYVEEKPADPVKEVKPMHRNIFEGGKKEKK